MIILHKVLSILRSGIFPISSKATMLGSKLDNNINIVMDDIAVTSTDYLELIGVSIERNLRFDEHISKIYKKSSQLVGVLMRLRNLIPTSTKL